ncbi:MAG: hypothetical protein QOI41_2541 [Myxococcales bacterium]|nr:hypothetical protein [Myxococcales bacterium]
MPNANAPAERHESAATMASAGGRIRRAAIFASALAVGAYLLAAAHVPCGFARIFHVPCPGCGSTRAMLALASGDLAGLVRYNPLAPFMTLLVVALAGQALASVLATGTFRRVGDGAIGMLVARGVMVIAALEVLLWIARFGGFLGGPVPV